MPTVHDWSSNFSTGTVDTTSNMPDLEDNVDYTRKSHYLALRDSLIACEVRLKQKLITISADPGSDVTVSTSYIQFLPSTGSETFSVDHEREFIVIPTLNFGAGSLSTFQFKIVFDEGETYEQTVGDDEVWRTRGDDGGAYRPITLLGAVTLTQGSHTVKMYAKRTAGSSDGKVFGSGGDLQSTGYMKPALQLV